MSQRVFTREELEEMGVPYEWDATPGKAAKILDRKHTEDGRWVSHHEAVFRAPDDGKTYRVEYQKGLTEVQEDTDLWYEDHEITATEVDPYDVTVIVTRYRAVSI